MSSYASGLSGMKPSTKRKVDLGSDSDDAAAKFRSAMQSDKAGQEFSNLKQSWAADDAADPDPGRFTAPQKNVTAPGTTFADSLRMRYKDYSGRTGSK